jgi:hypothetical protein
MIDQRITTGNKKNYTKNINQIFHLDLLELESLDLLELPEDLELLELDLPEDLVPLELDLLDDPELLTEDELREGDERFVLLTADLLERVFLGVVYVFLFVVLPDRVLESFLVIFEESLFLTFVF